VVDSGAVGVEKPDPAIFRIALERAGVEAAGGTKIHGPSEIPGVGTHAYCADPEGTMFGLLQPVERKG